MDAVILDKVSLARHDRVILSQVDARIGAGEFIGVFGPNGAGKTTLLQAVLGLLRPAGGRILVFGEVPRRGNLAAGYVPQSRSPLSDLRLRGWDFVAGVLNGQRWGLPLLGRAGRREVDWAIAMVEADALARRPVSELSGGERQRLLLAQALVGRPKLLLLDEPLISLDPHYQQAVVDLVRRIQQALKITVLFTAHDLNPLLGAMDRVLYLGQGQAAIGREEEVITAPVLSRLYGTEIEVLRVAGRIIVVTARNGIALEVHAHDHEHAHS